MACCILLDISSVFCKKFIFRILAIIFVRFGFFEVFRAFFLYMFWGFRFDTHTQIVSVLTHIDFCHAWAIFGPLVDKNTRKGELVELPASDTWGLSFIRIRSLPLKSFLDFFLNVVPYQLESWFIHWVGCTTYWVHVSLEWDPCDLHVLSLGTVN